VWARSLLLLLSMLASARTAAAQSPQETALARSLFQEGVALGDRHDWAGAADRFGRAYSLKPTSGIAFNWASALVETGKLLHARELLLQVERDPAADPELRRESSAMLKSLDARIAHLRVMTDREPSADATISVDGRVWPRAAWGVESPIDPGTHTIVRSEDGDELMRADVSLRDGEHRDVNLTLASPESDAEADQRVDASARKPLYKSWILWSAVGVVVVGGVVAGVLIARSSDSKEATPVMGNTTPGVLRW